METGKEFYGECSLYHDSIISPEALKINGFKEADILPGMKQAAHELYYKFYIWAMDFPQQDYILAGHNLGTLDIPFLKHYHFRLFADNISFPFGHRSVDLHSVAYAYFGKSLSHEAICTALGLPVEPKPHHALEGARSESLALKLLLQNIHEAKLELERAALIR